MGCLSAFDYLIHCRFIDVKYDKVKLSTLMFVLALHGFAAPSVPASVTQNELESGNAWQGHCFTRVADSEQNQEQQQGNQEEAEEEPDCE